MKKLLHTGNSLKVRNTNTLKVRNTNNTNLYLYSVVYPEIQSVQRRLKYNKYKNYYYNEIHKSM